MCTLTFTAIVSLLKRFQVSVPVPNGFGMETRTAASCFRSRPTVVCVGVAAVRGVSRNEAAARRGEDEDDREASADGGTTWSSGVHKCRVRSSGHFYTYTRYKKGWYGRYQPVHGEYRDTY